MSPVTGLTTLTEKYSGIPERLLDKATALKRKPYALATIDVVPRSIRIDLPVIPKGTPDLASIKQWRVFARTSALIMLN